MAYISLVRRASSRKRGGSHLPYASIDDLPPPVRSHLPLHAQEIYLAAFNNAWTEYHSHGPEQREQTAHRVAWAAVKRKYRNPATVGFHANPAESTAPSRHAGSVSPARLISVNISLSERCHQTAKPGGHDWQRRSRRFVRTTAIPFALPMTAIVKCGPWPRLKEREPGQETSVISCRSDVTEERNAA